MTLAQAARYLHVGEKILLKLVAGGQVEGTKAGQSWTFEQADLDTWLAG